MADRYWIASSASTWNSTSNWSETSGGSSGASVPGSSDHAHFDGNGVGNCDVTAAFYTVAQCTLASGYTGKLWQSARGFTVTGTLSIASGATVECGGSSSQGIYVNGDVVNNGTISGTGYFHIQDVTGSPATRIISGSGSFGSSYTRIETSGNFLTKTIRLGSNIDINGSLEFVSASNSGAHTFQPYGYDITISGNVSYTLTGTSTMSWSAGAGTITLDGTNQSIDFNGQTTEDTVIDSDGTITLADDWDVDGSLTINDGNLDINGYDLTGDSLTATTSNSAIQVTDTAGTGTIGVTGAITLNGDATYGVVWAVDGSCDGATSAASYTDVQNSTMTVGGTDIDATDNCTDTGTNTGWDFGGGGPTYNIPAIMHHLREQGIA